MDASLLRPPTQQKTEIAWSRYGITLIGLLLTLGAAFWIGFVVGRGHAKEEEITLPGTRSSIPASTPSDRPVVIMTWLFSAEGSNASYNAMVEGVGAVDAVHAGVRVVEVTANDPSVGYGSHPDVYGNVTQDAMIMDGETFNVGCVGALRGFRSPIDVARVVMDNTDHSLLVGQGAADLAAAAGLTPNSTETPNSEAAWRKWVEDGMVPFYAHPPSLANAIMAVGGFNYTLQGPNEMGDRRISPDNHDTVGAVVLDKQGKMACAVSTNGMNHKLHGRVGDAPLPGSGCWVDQEVGGAAGTGDGDLMLRFVPSFAAVSLMRSGHSVQDACNLALAPIYAAFGNTTSASLVCLGRDGTVAVANIGNVGWGFSYSYRTPHTPGVVVVRNVL